MGAEGGAADVEARGSRCRLTAQGRVWQDDAGGTIGAVAPGRFELTGEGGERPRDRSSARGEREVLEVPEVSALGWARRMCMLTAL